MTIQQTLADLVAINSVSARSNAEIVDYLSQRCESRGLGVRRFPYTDDQGIEKVNLIALAGAGFSDNTAVELTLVGHTTPFPMIQTGSTLSSLPNKTANFLDAAPATPKHLSLQLFTRLRR